MQRPAETTGPPAEAGGNRLFRSIVNNIPQVVYLMGGSAGLAGGAAIAAVALNQLINRWDSMVDAMKSSWLNVPADHLEKLRIRAEKATEAFGKLMAAPSKLEEKHIDVLTDVMRGADKGGQRMVMKGLREAIEQDPAMKPKLEPADAPEIAKRMIMMAAKRAWQFQPVLGARQLEEKVKKEMLQERLATATEQLMGQALIPGEEGQGARANISRLVEQYKGAFTPKFRKAMQEATEDAVEHAEANRDAAKMMMQSPLGTKMLLAGPPKARVPMTREQAESLMRSGKHVFIPPGGAQFARMLDKLAGAGLTQAEGAEVFAGMKTKDVADYARKNRLPFGVAREQMMEKGIEAVRNKPNPMDAAIDARLKAAGIEGDAPGVRREMRKLMDDRLKAIMLERGLTKEQAQLFMLKEQGERAFPGFNKPAEFVGLVEKSRRLMTSGLGSQDIGRRSLDELIAIRKAIQGGQKVGEAGAAANAANMALAAGPN